MVNLAKLVDGTEPKLRGWLRKKKTIVYIVGWVDVISLRQGQRAALSLYLNCSTYFCHWGLELTYKSVPNNIMLKVHKIEIFFGFDFEICIITLLVM